MHANLGADELEPRRGSDAIEQRIASRDQSVGLLDVDSLTAAGLVRVARLLLSLLLQPRVERLEGALRQRHGFRAECLEIVLRERLGGERRIGRVGGECQVHFSGPPTELESEVDVRTHRFLDALRDLRRRKLGEPSRRGDHGGGDGADPIVVAADFVCRVRPAVGLTLDELLDHRERGRVASRARIPGRQPRPARGGIEPSR